MLLGMHSSAAPEGPTEDPHAGHFVLMYGCDQQPLVRGVAHYLAEGLERGESAVVIATRLHADAFVARLGALGARPYAAIADGRLVIHDAEETLARFVVDGQPDWNAFEQSVGTIVSELRAATPAGVRAYGEMVGVLWEAGRYTAAIRLEEFWNTLLLGTGIKLFCAYPIDVCGDAFTPAEIDAVMCAHTHLLPSRPSLEAALERAMSDVLGASVTSVRTLAEDAARPAWAAMPRAESMILWLRDNLPAHSGAILARAREYTQRAA
ncbi:MAG: sensor histidine kinase [Candidatus Eremiobacteraeota bacterium]|nr:sensor histidine kinase [Candidatus Eremiobacteraeota bacterium]